MGKITVCSEIVIPQLLQEAVIAYTNRNELYCDLYAEQVESLGYKKIGNGSNKVVYRKGDYAIKFPFGSNGEEESRNQNKISSLVKHKHLLNTLANHRTVTIEPVVDVIENSRESILSWIKLVLKDEVLLSSVEKFITELCSTYDLHRPDVEKRSSWGWIGNVPDMRLVVFDYGLTREMYQRFYKQEDS